jgi:hypothetical protein
VKVSSLLFKHSHSECEDYLPYCEGCENQEQCLQCNQLYSLQDGECVEICNPGFYKKMQYENDKYYVCSGKPVFLKVHYCKHITQYLLIECDESCYSCIGDSASECTSCREDEYLAMTEENIQKGTCHPKTEGDFALEYYISNLDADYESIKDENEKTGTLDDPFIHLTYAIEKVNTSKI